jgi:hypothetical protein
VVHSFCFGHMYQCWVIPYYYEETTVPVFQFFFFKNTILDSVPHINGNGNSIFKFVP